MRKSDTVWKCRRTRAVFPEWEIEAEFVYDPTVLSATDLRRFVERAGRHVGLGSWANIMAVSDWLNLSMSLCDVLTKEKATMRKVRMKIVGTQPLMVSNPHMANPLNPLARKVSAIAGKRKKTEDDHLEIQSLKWQGSLYYDEEIGPYLPEDCLWSSIEVAAKMSKEGPSIRQGLQISGAKFPILYDGPRDLQGMYSDPEGRFVDVRDANASGRKIQAARAVFPTWAIVAEFMYDPEVLDLHNLKRLVQTAGLRAGTGTYRKKFGRFKLVQFEDLGEIEIVHEIDEAA